VTAYIKGPVELRLGDYREVLADVEAASVDAVLADPPFSERVHRGQRTGSSTRKTTLSYDPWEWSDCRDLAERWEPVVWLVVFSDHKSQSWHEAAAEEQGRYTFAPVIALRACPTPRMSGDGPTSAADYITISRPKRRLPQGMIGSRPGYYIAPHTSGPGYILQRVHPGGKAVSLMRALVRDYSRPGGLIVDPCAGGGTTLIAAALEGRRAIGAEIDPETYAKACARIERTALTPPLPFTERAPSIGAQGGLFG